MSTERMSTCTASAAQGFSSTPLKSSNWSPRPLGPRRSLEDCVLSEDEDTFSLLSPIYHDSSDSDEEQAHSPDHHVDLTSPRQSNNSRLSVSPVRYSSKVLRVIVHKSAFCSTPVFILKVSRYNRGFSVLLD